MQQTLVCERGLSVRSSCRLSKVSRSHLSEPRSIDNETLREEIRRLSYQYPRFGYRRIHGILTTQLGWQVNLKRVKRIRGKEGLQVKTKSRKRRRGKGVETPEKAICPNHIWTLDFVQDKLSRGSSIRMLTLLDEFTRQCLCIRVERRLNAKDVQLTLETLFKDYGIPYLPAER